MPAISSRLPLSLLLSLATATALYADGPADNIAAQVRPVPPPGVTVPQPDMARLLLAAVALETEASATCSAADLPDVVFFSKAVEWALMDNMIYDAAKDIAAAEKLLETGRARMVMIRNKDYSWRTSPGLVVRGYRSVIDDSVQPYGIVIPQSYGAAKDQRHRLDCWFHGRGEKLSELDFLRGRMQQPGEFTPADTLVLHPYGRYCNGQRFAGETDFLEALAAVQRDYRVDDRRIVVRGFSLGGAACWHIATHHAWRWCAANPGAGFSETEKFLNFFQGETLQPPAWERTLWNLYDATAVAGNLRHLPTVAYSGEIDKQKQAADLMAEACRARGMELTHIIGPATAHKYEPAAKEEVARRIDAMAAAGRPEGTPPIHAELYTLRYGKLGWITVDGMGEHWKKATLTAAFKTTNLEIDVENIASLKVHADCQGKNVIIRDDSRTSTIAVEPGSAPPADGWRFTRAADGQWQTSAAADTALRKKPMLQGPVDDAFMDSFLFVRPGGKAANEKAGAWAQAEMDRAIREWRRHFRGEVRVVDDKDADLADTRHHLILWGDPSSNSLIRRAMPQLPIQWSGSEIKAGPGTWSAAGHALICIYPNPAAPGRYIVLNSGFTYREYDYLNNARQTPKLPDWAVIDLATPPDSRYPGAIPAAGFFDENWQIKTPER